MPNRLPNSIQRVAGSDLAAKTLFLNRRLSFRRLLWFDWRPGGQGSQCRQAKLAGASKSLRYVFPVHAELLPKIAGLCTALRQFRNYCGLIKIARCGFPWKKTTKRPIASVYTYCETALGGELKRGVFLLCCYQHRQIGIRVFPGGKKGFVCLFGVNLVAAHGISPS